MEIGKTRNCVQIPHNFSYPLSTRVDIYLYMYVNTKIVLYYVKYKPFSSKKMELSIVCFRYHETHSSLSLSSSLLSRDFSQLNLICHFRFYRGVNCKVCCEDCVSLCRVKYLQPRRVKIGRSWQFKRSLF